MVSFKLLIVIAIGATSLTKSVENNRIVGGTEAEAHEFPYQVSLQWNYTNGKPPKHFCGGSLIAESYVITAAHCTVSSADNDWLEVVAGEHDLLLSDENVQRRRVIKMFVHEKFNVEQVGPWDIAVLKLDEPFQLTSSVRLIELPAKGVLHHGKGVVSGWGGISTDFFPDMPNVLMVGNNFDSWVSHIKISYFRKPSFRFCSGRSAEIYGKMNASTRAMFVPGQEMG